jgi:hypothetical protein
LFDLCFSDRAIPFSSGLEERGSLLAFTELVGDGIDIETKPVIWTGGIRTAATAPDSVTLFVQLIDPIGRDGFLVILAT